MATPTSGFSGGPLARRDNVNIPASAANSGKQRAFPSVVAHGLRVPFAPTGAAVVEPQSSIRGLAAPLPGVANNAAATGAPGGKTALPASTTASSMKPVFGLKAPKLKASVMQSMGPWSASTGQTITDSVASLTSTGEHFSSSILLSQQLHGPNGAQNIGITADIAESDTMTRTGAFSKGSGAATIAPLGRKPSNVQSVGQPAAKRTRDLLSVDADGAARTQPAGLGLVSSGAGAGVSSSAGAVSAVAVASRPAPAAAVANVPTVDAAPRAPVPAFGSAAMAPTGAAKPLGIASSFPAFGQRAHDAQSLFGKQTAVGGKPASMGPGVPAATAAVPKPAASSGFTSGFSSGFGGFGVSTSSAVDFSALQSPVKPMAVSAAPAAVWAGKPPAPVSALPVVPPTLPAQAAAGTQAATARPGPSTAAFASASAQAAVAAVFGSSSRPADPAAGGRGDDSPLPPTPPALRALGVRTAEGIVPLGPSNASSVPAAPIVGASSSVAGVAGAGAASAGAAAAPPSFVLSARKSTSKRRKSAGAAILSVSNPRGFDAADGAEDAGPRMDQAHAGGNAGQASSAGQGPAQTVGRALFSTTATVDAPMASPSTGPATQPVASPVGLQAGATAPAAAVSSSTTAAADVAMTVAPIRRTSSRRQSGVGAARGSSAPPTSSPPAAVEPVGSAAVAVAAVVDAAPGPSAIVAEVASVSADAEASAPPAKRTRRKSTGVIATAAAIAAVAATSAETDAPAAVLPTLMPVVVAESTGSAVEARQLAIAHAKEASSTAAAVSAAAVPVDSEQEETDELTRGRGRGIKSSGASSAPPSTSSSARVLVKGDAYPRRRRSGVGAAVPPAGDVSVPSSSSAAAQARPSPQAQDEHQPSTSAAAPRDQDEYMDFDSFGGAGFMEFIPQAEPLHAEAAVPTAVAPAVAGSGVDMAPVPAPHLDASRSNGYGDDVNDREGNGYDDADGYDDAVNPFDGLDDDLGPSFGAGVYMMSGGGLQAISSSAAAGGQAGAGATTVAGAAAAAGLIPPALDTGAGAGAAAAAVTTPGRTRPRPSSSSPSSTGASEASPARRPSFVALSRPAGASSPVRAPSPLRLGSPGRRAGAAGAAAAGLTGEVLMTPNRNNAQAGRIGQQHVRRMETLSMQTARIRRRMDTILSAVRAAGLAGAPVRPALEALVAELRASSSQVGRTFALILSLLVASCRDRPTTPASSPCGPGLSIGRSVGIATGRTGAGGMSTGMGMEVMDEDAENSPPGFPVNDNAAGAAGRAVGPLSGNGATPGPARPVMATKATGRKGKKPGATPGKLTRTNAFGPSGAANAAAVSGLESVDEAGTGALQHLDSTGSARATATAPALHSTGNFYSVSGSGNVAHLQPEATAGVLTQINCLAALLRSCIVAEQLTRGDITAANERNTCRNARLNEACTGRQVTASDTSAVAGAAAGVSFPASRAGAAASGVGQQRAAGAGSSRLPLQSEHEDGTEDEDSPSSLIEVTGASGGLFSPLRPSGRPAGPAPALATPLRPGTSQRPLSDMSSTVTPDRSAVKPRAVRFALSDFSTVNAVPADILSRDVPQPFAWMEEWGMDAAQAASLLNGPTGGSGAGSGAVMSAAAKAHVRDITEKGCLAFALADACNAARALRDSLRDGGWAPTTFDLTSEIELCESTYDAHYAPPSPMVGFVLGTGGAPALLGPLLQLLCLMSACPAPQAWNDAAADVLGVRPSGPASASTVASSASASSSVSSSSYTVASDVSVYSSVSFASGTEKDQSRWADVRGTSRFYTQELVRLGQGAPSRSAIPALSSNAAGSGSSGLAPFSGSSSVQGLFAASGSYGASQGPSAPSLPFEPRLSEVLSSAMRYHLRRALNSHMYGDEDEEEESDEEDNSPSTGTGAAGAGASAAGKGKKVNVDGPSPGHHHHHHSADGPLAKRPRTGTPSWMPVNAGGIGRAGGGIDNGFLTLVQGYMSFNTDDLAAVVHRALRVLHYGRQPLLELIAPHKLTGAALPESDDGMGMGAGAAAWMTDPSEITAISGIGRSASYLDSSSRDDGGLSLADLTGPDGPASSSAVVPAGRGGRAAVLTVHQIIDAATVPNLAAAAEYTAAHAFLRTVLGHEMAVAAASKDGDSWRKLRIFSRIAIEYGCEAVAPLTLLESPAALLIQLQEEASVVDAIAGYADQTLDRHARALDNERRRVRRRGRSALNVTGASGLSGSSGSSSEDDSSAGRRADQSSHDLSAATSSNAASGGTSNTRPKKRAHHTSRLASPAPADRKRYLNLFKSSGSESSGCGDDTDTDGGSTGNGMEDDDLYPESVEPKALFHHLGSAAAGGESGGASGNSGAGGASSGAGSSGLRSSSLEADDGSAGAGSSSAAGGGAGPARQPPVSRYLALDSDAHAGPGGHNASFVSSVCSMGSSSGVGTGAALTACRLAHLIEFEDLLRPKNRFRYPAIRFCQYNEDGSYTEGPPVEPSGGQATAGRNFIMDGAGAGRPGHTPGRPGGIPAPVGHGPGGGDTPGPRAGAMLHLNLPGLEGLGGMGVSMGAATSHGSSSSDASSSSSAATSNASATAAARANRKRSSFDGLSMSINMGPKANGNNNRKEKDRNSDKNKDEGVGASSGAPAPASAGAAAVLQALASSGVGIGMGGSLGSSIGPGSTGASSIGAVSSLASSSGPSSRRASLSSAVPSLSGLAGLNLGTTTLPDRRTSLGPGTAAVGGGAVTPSGVLALGLGRLGLDSLGATPGLAATTTAGTSASVAGKTTALDAASLPKGPMGGLVGLGLGSGATGLGLMGGASAMPFGSASVIGLPSLAGAGASGAVGVSSLQASLLASPPPKSSAANRRLSLPASLGAAPGLGLQGLAIPAVVPGGAIAKPAAATARCGHCLQPTTSAAPVSSSSSSLAASFADLASPVRGAGAKAGGRSPGKAKATQAVTAAAAASEAPAVLRCTRCFVSYHAACVGGAVSVSVSFKCTSCQAKK